VNRFDPRSDLLDNAVHPWMSTAKLRSKSVAGYAQIYIIDPDRNIIEFNCETMD
jgi:hypothetical protein